MTAYVNAEMLGLPPRLRPPTVASKATRMDISEGLDVANPQAALLRLARWLRDQGELHAAVDVEYLARDVVNTSQTAYIQGQLRASRAEVAELKAKLAKAGTAHRKGVRDAQEG